MLRGNEKRALLSLTVTIMKKCVLSYHNSSGYSEKMYLWKKRDINL